MNKARVRRVHEGIIYGPVNSRRFGVSLGINLSGKGKYCSFNCPYCFRGFNQGRPDQKEFLENLPTCDQVLTALKSWLKTEGNENIQDWTIAGNAEPTDNPEFPLVVEALTELRTRLKQEVKITVLTNGMGLIPNLNSNHNLVRLALEQADQACLKLDSGKPDTWQRIARPFAEVTFSEWLAAVEKVQKPVLQSLFFQGRIDNTTPVELERLKKCYHHLKPKDFHVLTINKKPADSTLKPIEPERLKEIEDILRESIMAPEKGGKNDSLKC